MPVTGQTEANLIGFGVIGLWLVAAALGFLGMRSGYSRPVPSGFAFRRPLAQCAFLGVIAMNCLLLPMLEASYDLRLYGQVRPDHWPFLTLFAAFGLAGAALLVWGGQFQDLVVDVEQGTYQRSAGWPPFRRVRTGPLSDLVGVGDEYQGRGSYLVYMQWQGKGGRMMVSRFRSECEAEHYADGLAAVLGVPRLAPPKPCRFLPGASPVAGQQRLPLMTHGARPVRLRKACRGQSRCGRRTRL